MTDPTPQAAHPQDELDELDRLLAELITTNNGAFMTNDDELAKRNIIEFRAALQAYVDRQWVAELEQLVDVETHSAQDNEFSDGYMHGFNSMRKIVEERLANLRGADSQEGAE